MEFEIVYYEDKYGKSSVGEFLDKLSIENKVLFNQTSKALEKLKNRFYHKEPLSKYIESGLWEVRIKAGTDILRIFYTFKKGKVIILLHVFIKKSQKTPINELEIARKRLIELKLREES